MKAILASILLSLVAGSALARPVIVEERGRIENPLPGYPAFANAVGLDGEFAILSAHRDLQASDTNPAPGRDFAALLFRRSTTGWTYVRPLFTEHHSEFDLFDYGISMKDGLAAVASRLVRIYQRQGNDWIFAAAPRSDPGPDVEVNAGRILRGGTQGTWAGELFEHDLTTATWRLTQTLLGEPRGGDDEFSGGPVDLEGNHAVISSPVSDEPGIRTPSFTVYLQAGASWGAVDTITAPEGVDPRGPEGFGTEVAMRGTDLVIAGTNRSGSYLYRPDPTDGGWTRQSQRLQPLNSFMGDGAATSIRKSADFILQRSFDPDRDVQVINVFAPDEGNVYRHVAVLRAGHGDSLGDFAISGRRVLAKCGESVCEFELPTSLTAPLTRQHTFTLAADDFTTSAGSQFAVVTGASGRVYRQSNITLGLTHAAVFSSTNWTNQSMQADIRPLAFNGNDRWVGLATRYRDTANYYYVTLRGSGSVQLKRMVNGAFSTIASAPITVNTSRTYRLRLESTGSNHRVYVDEQLLLDADDDSLKLGRAALLTYGAQADFDNVFASPSPLTTIRADDFDPCCSAFDWSQTPGGLWTTLDRDGNGVLAQTSVDGEARAFTGVATGDQTVDVRVRPDTFATGGGTQDRWVGAIVRYRDAQNYYYVTLRSSNTISLRKLSNGVIHELRTVPLPVMLGQWQQLRFEALGTRLRVYVNGTLRLEATDAEHAEGVAGLMTWRAAADFDEFRAVQP